jgi:hypothetical protein
VRPSWSDLAKAAVNGSSRVWQSAGSGSLTLPFDKVNPLPDCTVLFIDTLPVPWIVLLTGSGRLALTDQPKNLLPIPCNLSSAIEQ